jgi:hypothetical protein
MAKRRVAMAEPAPRATSSDDEICSAYLEARQACGQGAVDSQKVSALLDKQRDALREKYGCKDVKFRVVVESGKTKLKATPIR